MAERKRIGILLQDSDGWAGGFYYSLNVIKAFNVLPDKEKPILYIFYYNTESISTLNEIGYEYIHYLPVYKKLNLAKRTVNRIVHSLIKSTFFPPGKYKTKLVDFIFPYNYLGDYLSLRNLNKVYWIPDFQHLYYPDNFSKEQLEKRNKCIEELSKKTDSLVLSSQSAYNDYKKFYPAHKNKVFVVPFASTLPDISTLNWAEISAKFQIKKPYFFCPNQFWKHKNHIVVLKALRILKQKEIDCLVIFSGKDDGKNEKEYVESLKKYVNENHLEDTCMFLGFIDRKEQLLIMKQALAVIQPSLFEGWSTVIEDAKALNQFIIASDLDVHKEQLANNSHVIFSRNNEMELARTIESCLLTEPKKVNNTYTTNIKTFADKLLSIEPNSQ